MRSSAVAQSFRALAAKINNQAPLGARESDRLLTALTSSFRKHLDEVHPNQLHHEGNPSSARPDSGSFSRHGVHSSTVLADKHMASVLTNPLLIKSARSETRQEPKLNANTAVVELKHGTNPFELLEFYHAKGCATIDVALSCMKHFRRSIKDTTFEKQVDQVQAEQAGKRLLTWLWNSDVLHTDAYASNVQFQDGLVWLVMMEGHEEFLWQWLQSDMELPQPSIDKGYSKSTMGHFWKSRIIYAMVMTKLSPPHRGARSADAALELYFSAAELMRHRKSSGVQDGMVLMNRARQGLEKALTHASGHRYSNTNPAIYDKFVRLYASHEISYGYNAEKYALNDFRRAKLKLWHPAQPSADLWYEIVSRDVSEVNGTNAVHELLQSPKSSSDKVNHIRTFARAASLLKFAGKDAESARLVSLMQTFYPDNALQVTQALRDQSLEETRDVHRDSESVQQQHEQQHQHSWLSGYVPAPG